MTRPSRIERTWTLAGLSIGLAVLAGCAEWPSAGYAPPPRVTRKSPAATSKDGLGIAHRTEGTSAPTYRWPARGPELTRPVTDDTAEALALSTFGGSLNRRVPAAPQDHVRTPAQGTAQAPRPAAPVAGEHAGPRFAAAPSNPPLDVPASRDPSYERMLGVPMQPDSAANATPGDPGTSVSRVSFASEGADFDPDVSRDGREVVFASTQHRTAPDIYVKQIGSRVVTQLTTDPAQDLMPKFSPDGRRIAFASDRNGNWDVFVMPADGGRAVQVTDSTAPELHPSWSPDGTRLVFCRLGEVSAQWEMWVADAANPGLAQFVGYGLFPEWCPAAGTGQGGADRILFQRSRLRGDRSFAVWTIDYHAGDARNATEIASSTTAACINPAWSPDGRWIVYASVPNAGAWTNTGSSRPPSAELWMADLNGAARVKLTSTGALALMPAWGAGGRVYFVSNRGGADNIWSLDAQGAVDLASSMIAPPDGATGVATVSEETDEPAAPHR